MTERAPRRKPLAVGLAILIVATIVAASAWGATQARTELESWTADRAEVAESVVQEVINDVFNDLEAVAAFVEEADPDAISFDHFVATIDGTANAAGLAYVTIVPDALLDVHIEEQVEERGDFYFVSALDSKGERTPVDRAGRTAYYPVQLLALGEFIRPFIQADIPADQLGVGVDVGYNVQWRTHITDAVSANGPTISEFIQVQLDVVTLDSVFFVSVPVHDQDGTLRGLVAAPMLETLLLRDLDKRVLDDVVWEVIPQGATPTRIGADEATIYPLEMAGTTWSLAIAPTDAARARLLGPPSWVIGLAAGTLVALAALAFWLSLDRRSEHRRVAQFKQVADDKDRFLASVSHELRTPLTVVSGVANELHDKPGGFTMDEQSEMMEMLVEQTDELAAIVEDLLIAARSDIGKVVIHYRETNLLTEATRAMDTAGATATVQGDPGLAWADDQRVRQILRNLLTNARRYGGPAIRLEFARDANWVEVVVADNGAGVPPRMQQSMFESYQSSHKPDVGVRSVGLGLYVSRSLATAMGGQLQYSYDGVWSRFRLRLRASRPEEHS